jgi:hypothetical protein
MAAMGAEGKVSTQLFLALGASDFLGIGGSARARARRLSLLLVAQNLGLVVSLLETLDGLADAFPQFWQALGAEQQKHNDQNDENGSPTVAKHDGPLQKIIWFKL